MKYLKIHFILIIIFLFYSSIFYSFADDKLDESHISLNMEELISTSSEVGSVPNLNARYATIYDRASKTILYDKNANEKTKMASTTKIMTAIVVLENSNLQDIVTISKKAALTGGSRLGLSTNDKISVENLLYGLLLCSGNDAAVALAEHIGGNVENFAKMMNEKARKLGLSSTNFVTPHGLDSDEHYTTAYELAKITDYALENGIFSKIVKTKSYTITINNHSKSINNTNELLGNLEGVYGVKTGFTNGANRCLVTSCKRQNLDIICVVLGCDTKKDRTKDSINLINYAFNNFSVVNIEEIIDRDFANWSSEHKNSFTIDKGISNDLDLYLDKNHLPYSNIAIKNADINNLSTSISFNSFYNSPLGKNTKIGTLTLKSNDTELLSIDILNNNYITKKTIFDYIHSFIYNYHQILKSYI